MPSRPQEIMDLALLAVRMRRAQRDSAGRYHAAAFARKRELEEKFEAKARQVLGQAGEVRQPAEMPVPR